MMSVLCFFSVLLPWLSSLITTIRSGNRSPITNRSPPPSKHCYFPLQLLSRGFNIDLFCVPLSVCVSVCDFVRVRCVEFFRFVSL